jgi:hypothetical protein
MTDVICDKDNTDFISVLNDCHILSIFWWVSFLKVDPNSAISFCMLCTSAFFHKENKKEKKTRIDIKDYKQKSRMKSGKQARNT